jgi:UDP-N-acetylglucosamine 2-epimerase (non-hydrolysing)
MPEEVNRILTDEMTQHFFITEKSGMENLKALGKLDDQLHLVGNTMIDTLVVFDNQIDQSTILKDLGMSQDYCLFTFHRPGNVDDPSNAKKLVQLLSEAAAQLQGVFPVHPRTVKMMEQFGFLAEVKANANITLTEPLDYFSFQKLVKHAKVVITDSGGMQEETTFRQVPCLTVRPNTDHPITVKLVTNTLLDFDVPQIMQQVSSVLKGSYKNGQIPPLWDDKATQRILDVLNTIL